MLLFQVVTLLGGEDCFHKMLTIFRFFFFSSVLLAGFALVMKAMIPYKVKHIPQDLLYN
jgi:hypothetical protein